MRFGIMCNSMVFQKWQADAILELKRNGHEDVLLIIDARPVQKTSLISRLLHKKWSTILYTSLENRIFKPPAKRPVDLQKDLAGIGIMNCLVRRTGYSEYFDDQDSAAIRDCRLDFILRFGFSIIRGDILTAARFGVWSFHHDDEMIYRGGPPGFWEIFRGDPVSGAMMQRLTGKLDGGIVLKKGYLKTMMHSYRENLSQLLSVSSSWPARFADELSGIPGIRAKAAAPLAINASKTAAPLFRVPGNRQMLKFLWILFVNRIRFYFRDLVAAEIWNVGVIKKPIDEVALGNEKIREVDITWLPPVAHSGYLADPAGFHLDGRLHILAEEYSYITHKAGISEVVMEINAERSDDPGKFGRPESVMAGIPHLSYPYVFIHNNAVCCIPESYQSSQINLFRRDPATGKFTKYRTLLDNVRAVDPTLIFYNGFWWLFFTDRKHSNTHLFLYHSTELSGEFAPHPLNPVKTDIRSARPAGTPFLHGDALYRPAQDCSATYGGRVAINRVIRLTPDDFAEETVNFLEPVKGSYYGKGLHTISAVGNYTLIDGKRYRLNFQFFRHQLREKLMRRDPRNV